MHVSVDKTVKKRKNSRFLVLYGQFVDEFGHFFSFYDLVRSCGSYDTAFVATGYRFWTQEFFEFSDPSMGLNDINPSESRLVRQNLHFQGLHSNQLNCLFQIFWG